MFLKYLSEHKPSFMIYAGIIIFCLVPDYIGAENYKDTIEFTDIIEIYLFGPGICRIHNSEMSVENVSILYGLLSNEQFAYDSEIKSEMFPNCNDPVPAFSCIIGEKRYVKKYVCMDCNNDRDKWINDNWR